MANTIKIKQIRSTIGVPAKLRAIVKGLGLTKMNQVVVRPDNAGIRGMVAKAPHLLEVQQ
jgi:large subunit ribosomal protein L30